MVIRNSARSEHPKVYPEGSGKVRELAGDKNAMVTVYNNGKINEEYMDETFDVIRKRVETQWKEIPPHATSGVDSAISSWMAYERIIVAAGIHKWGKEVVESKLAAEYTKYGVPDGAEKNIVTRRIATMFGSEYQSEAECGGGRNSSLYRLDRILDDAMHGL